MGSRSELVLGPEVSQKDVNWREEAENTLAEARKDDEGVEGVTPNELNCLIDPVNAYVLEQLGGVDRLAEQLDTDLERGLDKDAHDEERRIERFGRNVLPEKKAKSLWKLMWIALQDKVLIILSIAAVISFALGLYETFGQPPEYDEEGHEIPKVEWVEGVAILVAVAIVVVVGAGNDWQKERQFVKLNKKKEDRKVKVIREGVPHEISIFHLMVGDLLLLEPGDMIPADGILIKGYDVKCDESSASGESATMTKHDAHDVMDRLKEDPTLNPHEKKLNCFLLSGAKVLGGTGHYLVTAVGPHSMHGRTMMSLQTDPEATPLQEKLNRIAEGIAKIGILAALILFIVLFIRFLVQLKGSNQTPAQKGDAFMKIFITAITIIVVAVPEGLPLAVTLALAFATTRMVKDNNLVRVMKSCETMGGASTVCSDKTGTLTQNKMTVVAGVIGSNVDKNTFEITPEGDNVTELVEDQVHDKDLKQLWVDSIAINSSAFEAEDNEERVEESEVFVGSKTETALLNFARNYLDMGGLEEYRNKCSVEQIYPFDSAKKFMSTVIKSRTDSDGYTVLLKGASEVVLSKCSRIYDPATQSIREMTSDDVQTLKDQIDSYAAKSLRTIGIVYKPLTSKELPTQSDANTREEHLFRNNDFVFLSVVGIQDPLRPGVKEAVKDCQKAGVVVRMVTGDNIHTARAIAKDCGILTGSSDEIVMEGPKFRKLDAFEVRKVAPKLRVLARSSPDDKRKLVKILKSQGEVVAVTGDGTNDAPALKLADVGFSMGIAGTEVAKEASEIILMDDNFGSIVKGIMWGRTVNDAVKKFLQFQLTVNVTAVALTFVSAVASSTNASVLTAVQLLWVNLIMDTFAALALATDPPAHSILDRPPDSRKASLISVCMWKMILGQAVLQLVITFVLHFKGVSLFNVDRDNLEERQRIDALVFNTFVWLQFFNILVNRRLDNKYNFFEGIFRNKFFIAIFLIIGGGQVLIMFVGGAAFSTKRPTPAQWGTAIICGLMSIPMALLLRTIPDRYVAKLYPARLVRFIRTHIPFLKKKSSPGIMVDDEEANLGVPNRYKWNPAIEQVREQLMFLKTFKGGRLSNLKFRPRQMYEQWRESRSPSPVPSEQNLYSPTLGGKSGSSSAGSPKIRPNEPVSGENGLLAVPNDGSTGASRGRGYSSSSSTIGALSLVPGIIGGAVAGWSPEQRENNNANTEE
ncbi:hypothetical protein TRICI_000599 [Trichomonascus ciferrii]|uniref:Calcium-transporting ATPase n=1 Tax=Trichomonascus ciferrii TaxID=44093 RepID=A0A642VBJ1_9ASCO|nr:hypothetical protein TRICI_000599 [Trichomonascus ciferrii]